MTAGFFDQIAEAQTPAPVKRKLAAAEKRRIARERADQDMKDQETLGRMYFGHLRAERDALLAGPHGRSVRGLVAFARTMTLSSAPALVELVRGESWAEAMTIDERFVLLRIVSAEIAACRKRNGLSPDADDAIPWCAPPKAYSQIKTLLELDGR